MLGFPSAPKLPATPRNPTFARHRRPSRGGQLRQVLSQLADSSGGIDGIREALGRE